MEKMQESLQGRRSGDCASSDTLKGSSGRGSSLPLGKRFSAATLQPLGATKVKFYRNGDINFGGTDVCISSQRYRSLDALMQDLNRKMNLPRGVRAIYTPGGATKISSMRDFQQGGCYVCSSKEGIKKIDYSAAESPQWLPFSKGKQNDQATGSFLASESLQLSSRACHRGLNELCGRKSGHGQRNVMLSVQSQWAKETRKLLVNRRMLRSWDDTLSEIAKVACVPRGVSPHLYNVNTGRPIDSLSKLMHCDTQNIVVKANGDTGNDQKCHDSATLIPAPAERPVLTGKSTPESVMANPSEDEVQLGSGNGTTQPDKDKESQQAALCVGTEGEPIIRELSNEAKPLTESELDSKSCNPNESLTQHVLPEHSSEQTTEEEQQMSAQGVVVEEEEEEESSTQQTMPLPGVVTFRLSDLPEPRERSESMRTEMSSFSSVANFRAGAEHIRKLHAISPASGSNISLSSPLLVKMKMNLPADLEEPMLLEGHDSLLSSSASKSVKETRDVGIQATAKGHEIDSVVEVNHVKNQGRTESQHDTASVTDLYKPGRTLGEGNYAKVQDCTQKDTNKRFLLKVISKAKIFGFEDVILRELNIMRLLNHPNIIKMEADFEDEDNHYLIMEHINGGDLFYAIMECQHFKESDAAVAMRNLGHALMYLHNHRIVHRGVSPENLFFCVNPDGTKILKLGNFGAAVHVTEPLSVICGSIPYVAPEMFFGTGYGVKVDMWATGVVCYIMLCGVSPFVVDHSDKVLYGRNKRSKEIVIEKIRSCRFNFCGRHWEEVSDTAKDFIRCLLVASPGKRHSAEDSLHHEWLQTTHADSSGMTLSESASSGFRLGTKLGFALTALDLHMKDPDRQFRVDTF